MWLDALQSQLVTAQLRAFRPSGSLIMGLGNLVNLPLASEEMTSAMMSAPSAQYCIFVERPPGRVSLTTVVSAGSALQAAMTRAITID